MKISLVNGVLKINDCLVKTITFDDGDFIRFPIDDVNDTLIVDDGGVENSIDIKGKRNTVISGKNIVVGSIIGCDSFRLGDE